MFIQLTPVNQVFADQYDVTILWDHVESSSRSPAFFKLTAVQVQVFDPITGPSYCNQELCFQDQLHLYTLYQQILNFPLKYLSNLSNHQIQPDFLHHQNHLKVRKQFFKKDKITIFILEPALLHFIFLVQCKSFRCCLFQQFR